MTERNDYLSYKDLETNVLYEVHSELYHLPAEHDIYYLKITNKYDTGATIELYEINNEDEAIIGDFIMELYRKWDGCSHLQKMGYFHYDSIDYVTELFEVANHLADLAMATENNDGWLPNCHEGWAIDKNEFKFKIYTGKGERK